MRALIIQRKLVTDSENTQWRKPSSPAHFPLEYTQIPGSQQENSLTETYSKTYYLPLNNPIMSAPKNSSRLPIYLIIGSLISIVTVIAIIAYVVLWSYISHPLVSLVSPAMTIASPTDVAPVTAATSMDHSTTSGLKTTLSFSNFDCAHLDARVFSANGFPNMSYRADENSQQGCIYRRGNKATLTDACGTGSERPGWLRISASKLTLSSLRTFLTSTSNEVTSFKFRDISINSRPVLWVSQKDKLHLFGTSTPMCTHYIAVQSPTGSAFATVIFLFRIDCTENNRQRFVSQLLP